MSECLKHSAICSSFRISHSLNVFKITVIGIWKQMQRYHGDYLAEVAHWLEVPLLVLFTVRHDDLRAHSSCKVECCKRQNLHVNRIKLTEFRYKITSEKSSATKDSDNVAAHCTVARCSIRNDWFTVRKRHQVMQSTLQSQLSCHKSIRIF